MQMAGCAALLPPYALLPDETRDRISSDYRFERRLAIRQAQQDMRKSLSALVQRGVIPRRRADVYLTRPADATARHFVLFDPVRDPACGARDREHHREHLGRNAQRIVDDARVEIDIRVQLALDEIIVFQRGFFELQ